MLILQSMGRGTGMRSRTGGRYSPTAKQPLKCGGYRIVPLSDDWPRYESTGYLYTVDFWSTFVNSRISLAFWREKHVHCWAKASKQVKAVSILFSGFREGGTGIEPAPCGFGDPIRRVGWCRAVSPHAALPHSRCRRVSPGVGGHWGTYWGTILEQPLLPWALFSLL